MTKLKDIFTKPLDRHIDGVIKANDTSSLKMELDEYVVTKEISEKLDKLLHKYNNNITDNGVWISGFFGSGKSHMLKILSLVLEDAVVGGESSASIFKNKLVHDAMLAGAFTKAVSTPSKSILFNIDQKATIISKQSIDALLSVFQQVFDESCGYSKIGYIAKFERDLDKRKMFEDFKREFANFSDSGDPWEKAREETLFYSKAISEAFTAVTGQDGTDVLDKVKKDYKVSIESFAEQVNEYIEHQPPGFRINFFVDEVGQYIADNVKLMLNLQSIAETFSVTCKGRAWIFATAQEALDKITGDMNKQMANDFSKIMDRFKTRIPLTSVNVEEVIQNRLLRKTDESLSKLKTIYSNQEANFGMLFDFSAPSVQLKNFDNETHFINSYPFIPYQYDLFRSCMQGLSASDNFEGRHSSVGERSMLGVFREVGLEMQNLELGNTAPFCRMFDGIRTALKTQAQNALLVAENNIDNKLAIDILKTLFLVKYYNQFSATLHNICVLMTTSFNQDLGKLKDEVQEALNILENQTYIRKSSEVYEYLTDTEKDIENEIKEVDIDNSERLKELQQIIYTMIIAKPKMKNQSGYDYSYTQKIDTETLGITHELSINVITPLNENYQNINALKMQSLNSDELLIVLEDAPGFSKDLVTYKQTEKYIRQNTASYGDPQRNQILSFKKDNNTKLGKSVFELVKKMLMGAKFIVRSEELEITGSDPKTRIESAFGLLVDRVYSKLSLLRGLHYTADTVRTSYNNAKNNMFSDNELVATEPEQEILNHVNRKKNEGLRVTLQTLEKAFKEKVYGWPSPAIFATLAGLFGKGTLLAKKDSNILAGNELITILSSNRDHAQVIVEIAEEISAAATSFLKDFYQNLFDSPSPSSDPREIVAEMKDSLSTIVTKIQQHINSVPEFPFSSDLSSINQDYVSLQGKDFDWYINELHTMADDIIEQKKKLDPIIRFLDGEQKNIYQSATALLSRENDNLSWVNADEIEKLRSILSDNECHLDNKMPEAKRLANSIEGQINSKRTSTIEEGLNEIEDIAENLKSNYQEEAQLEKITNALSGAKTEIAGANAIALIPTLVSSFKEIKLPEVISGFEGGITVELVPLNSITFEKPQAILSNNEDVDEYISNFEKALKDQISAGKKITT